MRPSIPEGQISHCQYSTSSIERNRTGFSTKRKGYFGLGLTQAV